MKGYALLDDNGKIPTENLPASQGGGEAFPVGSVFISVVSTDPATLLGYGTWSAFGAGKVLVGIDSNDTDFDAVEKTGGAKANTPSAHTGTAVADHSNVSVPATTTPAVKIGTSGASAAAQTHTHIIPTITHSVTQPSNHSALSVVQPYITVFMWKRLT